MLLLLIQGQVMRIREVISKHMVSLLKILITIIMLVQALLHNIPMYFSYLFNMYLCQLFVKYLQVLISDLLIGVVKKFKK